MAEEHVPHHRLKTVERYSAVLTRFIEAFDGMLLDDIDDAALWDYEQLRRGAGTSPATIYYELKVLNILFELAGLWKWTERRNPIKDYRKTRRSSGLKASDPDTRFYSEDEERRLIAVAPLIWQRRMVFAVETGLRKNEQFGVTWEHINAKTRRLTVPAELAKGKRKREIPLTKRAWEAALAMKQDGVPWVCPRENGQQFSTRSIKVWEVMQKFGRLADVEDVSWHAWRKTCGCRLLQVRRFTMEAVQRWLGHMTLKETERAYAFLFADHLQRMVEESDWRIAPRLEAANEDTKITEHLDETKQIKHLKT